MNNGRNSSRKLSLVAISATALVLASLATSSWPSAAVSVNGSVGLDGTPTVLAVSPNSQVGYVDIFDQPSTLEVFNTRTLAVTGTVDLPNYASAAAVTPDGKTLWVATQADGEKSSITLVSTATDRVTGRIGVNTMTFEAAEITFSSDGKLAYVVGSGEDETGYSPQVEVFDTSNGQIIKRYKLTTLPIRSLLSPNGKELFVLEDRGNSDPGVLQELTLGSGGRLSKPISVGLGPDCMAISPSGNLLYVGNYTSSSEGGSAVEAFSTSSNKVLSTFSSGQNALEGLAISASGRALYSSSSTASGVDVISTSTDQVISTVDDEGSSTALLASPDGRQLFSLQYSPAVTVFNTSLVQSGTRQGRVTYRHIFRAHLQTAGQGIIYRSNSLPKGLTVTADGVIRSSSSLATGRHVISGTVSDVDGDNGTWSFVLTVSR